jgi:hypothetical protein
MKIGINALFYQYPASGSGQYLSHLLHALSALDSRNEYILFGPRPLPQNNGLRQRLVKPESMSSMSLISRRRFSRKRQPLSPSMT